VCKDEEEEEGCDGGSSSMDEGCYHHHPSVAGPIRDLPGRRPAALQLMARPAR